MSTFRTELKSSCRRASDVERSRQLGAARTSKANVATPPAATSISVRQRWASQSRARTSCQNKNPKARTEASSGRQRGKRYNELMLISPMKAPPSRTEPPIDQALASLQVLRLAARSALNGTIVAKHVAATTYHRRLFSERRTRA